jgi:DNA repair protein RadD
MDLRPYQAALKNDIYSQWSNGATNVLGVLPTGGGKTRVFSDIISEHQGAACAIAHRQELVSQISLALARDKIRHKIIGPKSIVKLCVNVHMAELGINYYDANAIKAVAGINTLINRKVELKDWLESVSLVVIDEAHHVTKLNMWGKGFGMFPNAKGLGVTATPLRADGKGLGRHADGLFDCMVEGPNMRDLILMKFLTEYRIFAPPSDFVRPTDVAPSGEISQAKNTAAVRKSHIVGDVVSHYLRIAPGKLGVTFTESVETATDIAARFNAAGVPAAVVSAKTKDADRVSILKRFKARELMQLVNVDLFGEGFDLPAIEVVSMARATESYGLYVQQFGRSLRLLNGKQYAIIIDHVGNVTRHGLPDARREWTLDRRDKRSKSKISDAIPVKTCTNPACCAVYERIYKVCPYCGHVIQPTERTSPELVDGDLIELDAATLAVMRGDIDKVDASADEYRRILISKYVPPIGQLAHVKRHVANQEAQTALRGSIAWWAGYQSAQGRPDSESYRRFYFKYGIDVMTAQTLKASDALTLAENINKELGQLNK